jgi:hypothetical protein
VKFKRLAARRRGMRRERRTAIRRLRVAPSVDDRVRDPRECERITRAANEQCAQFQGERLERLTCLLVLLRYFEASGQIEPGTIGRRARADRSTAPFVPET